ncbi:MAG: hypothetical protein Q9M10_02675 [Mariprofundaceae bacterium]|nr:hypothetical protein [Mariprofundaceae bacterium]
MQLIRLLGLCVWMTWASLVHADDIRFQVHLNFEDAGVSPSIAEQVQQALPLLWQRIVPQSEQAKLHNLRAMPLLKSIRPQGLTSTVTFNEQRVWQTLDTHDIAYIRPLPSFHITLEVLDTLGREKTSIEHELNAYLDEVSQTWGIQRKSSAPLLALHVQWLNDVQFYVTAIQQDQDTQRDQNRWIQGKNPMQQLQISLQAMLLHARNQWISQPASKASHAIPQTMGSTVSFMLHIQGQSSLAHQILLETALQSDPRVLSITPTLIDSTSQHYQVVVKEAPEYWLTSWFAQRGMTANLGLEGWLAE